MGWFGGIGTVRPTQEFESRNAIGSVADSYSARKIYGAYQFSRSWGVEMGADLAYQGRRDWGLGDPKTYALDGSTRGWEFAGTGTWALSKRLGLTGKVGAYGGELNLTPNQGSALDGKTRAVLGVGLKYDFSSNFRLQGGWDRYRLGTTSAADDGRSADVDLLSIGLKYKF
jgi:hypothetical protein